MAKEMAVRRGGSLPMGLNKLRSVIWRYQDSIQHEESEL